MERYQLNMARDFVMPLESRRKWLHWLLAFLLAVCVIIACVLYNVILTTKSLDVRRNALDLQEQRILSDHPEFTTISGYLDSVGKRISGSLRDLSAVAEFERSESRVARILLGLTETLPYGFELGAFEFDGDARTVKFEVVLPAVLKLDDKLTPPHMVKVWEREPLLVGQVSQIEVENSERVQRHGVDLLCWRFAAKVGGK